MKVSISVLIYLGLFVTSRSYAGLYQCYQNLRPNSSHMTEIGNKVAEVTKKTHVDFEKYVGGYSEFKVTKGESNRQYNNLLNTPLKVVTTELQRKSRVLSANKFESLLRAYLFNQSVEKSFPLIHEIFTRPLYLESRGVFVLLDTKNESLPELRSTLVLPKPAVPGSAEDYETTVKEVLEKLGAPIEFGKRHSSWLAFEFQFYTKILSEAAATNSKGAWDLMTHVAQGHVPATMDDPGTLIFAAKIILLMRGKKYESMVPRYLPEWTFKAPPRMRREDADRLRAVTIITAILGTDDGEEVSYP